MPIVPRNHHTKYWTQYNLRQWSNKCRIKYQESSTGLYEVFRPYKCKTFAEAYMKYLDPINANLS